MTIHNVTRQELVSYIENDAKIVVDSFVESAMDLAEEVHSGITREDEKSSFLETHTWPVTLDVVKHYQKYKPGFLLHYKLFLLLFMMSWRIMNEYWIFIHPNLMDLMLILNIDLEIMFTIL